MSVDDQLHALFWLDVDDQLAWFIVLFRLISDGSISNRLCDGLILWEIATTRAIWAARRILAVKNIFGTWTTTFAARAARTCSRMGLRIRGAAAS